MPTDDDDAYHGVLAALAEVVTEVRQHKERVMATVTLFTNEFVRQQHLFDRFVCERKEERAMDDSERKAARTHADRFRWVLLAILLLLVVVNLLVLAFFIGRSL